MFEKIPTVEELMKDRDRIIELLEKQKPMRPDMHAEMGMFKVGACVICKNDIDNRQCPHFCGECGQAVKWE